jgi:VanZ family protein
LSGKKPVRTSFTRIAKFCTAIIIISLVVIALGPADWAPRSGLGWEIDHFVGYFVITCIVCIAWYRPVMVGGLLMFVAALLEGLQALTPDRSANFEAACYSIGGVLAAAMLAELVKRVRGRNAG